MAVAWIGNRETLVERAAAHAAALLGSSRCPVFSLDTDIHGTRAAIALAERVGAAYDHADGAAACPGGRAFYRQGRDDRCAGRGAPARRCRGDRRRTARRSIMTLSANSPGRFPISRPGISANSSWSATTTPAPPIEQRADGDAAVLRRGRPQRDAGGAEGAVARAPDIARRCRISTDFAKALWRLRIFPSSCFPATQPKGWRWRCCKA